MFEKIFNAIPWWLWLIVGLWNTSVSIKAFRTFESDNSTWVVIVAGTLIFIQGPAMIAVGLKRRRENRSATNGMEK